MTSGSYLSHGAIVAREYNIPSVVNFPGILTDLRQGALLVMDDEAASSAKRLHTVIRRPSSGCSKLRYISR